jgi:hypothetical protein
LTFFSQESKKSILIAKFPEYQLIFANNCAKYHPLKLINFREKKSEKYDFLFWGARKAPLPPLDFDLDKGLGSP